MIQRKILPVESMDSLFVGGSHNGMHHHVDIDTNEVKLPDLREQAKFVPPMTVMMSATLKVETYIAQRFCASSETTSQHFRLFVLEGLTPIDTMRLLIASYKK